MAACVVESFVIPELAELLPLDDYSVLQQDSIVTGEDGAAAFSALLAIRRALLHHPDASLAALPATEPFVVAQINNLRSAVSRVAVIAAGEMATCFGHLICCRHSVDAFVSSLLVKASGDKRFIRDPAVQSLKNLVAVHTPTALLFQALTRHSGSKNRTILTMSAEFGEQILTRLTPLEVGHLDLVSLATVLSGYNTSRSAEARACAHSMSRLVSSRRGYAPWAAAVQGVCREQDSREMLRGLGGEEGGVELSAVTGVQEPLGEGGEDKENAAGGTTTSLPPATPSRGLFMPGVPCRTSVGGGGCGGRASMGGSAGRGGAQSGGTPRLSAPSVCTVGGFAPRVPHVLTPLLVLHRTVTSPAGPLRAWASAEGPQAGGGVTGTLCFEGGAPSSGRKGGEAGGPWREQIVVPIGEDAEQLLEEWCVSC